jgi:hypothetical protein
MFFVPNVQKGNFFIHATPNQLGVTMFLDALLARLLKFSYYSVLFAMAPFFSFG